MSPWVVTASGLAREALAVLRLHGHRQPPVVDDDDTRWGTRLDGSPIIGPLDAVACEPERPVLVCAGRGRTRRDLCGRLEVLGVGPERRMCLVHPRVRVGETSEVGRGSIVLEGVVFTAGVRVGGGVVLMPHVTLTHDVVVEDYATLCAGVSLGGGVHVGEAAYVGMNASVREGVRIGAGATLGMGAVLLEDLPPGETWAGVPARPLHVAAVATAGSRTR